MSNLPREKIITIVLVAVVVFSSAFLGCHFALKGIDDHSEENETRLNNEKEDNESEQDKVLNEKTDNNEISNNLNNGSALNTTNPSNSQTNSNEISSNNQNSNNSKNETTSKPAIDTKPSTSTNNNQPITNPITKSYSAKDNKVISSFNTLENDVDKLLKEEKSESISDKAKGVFITIVDFIFYDGKISGVTFSELTDAGKEKVLAIASSIDQKIENKFPGYKETISDKATGAFNKASEIIKKGANNINEFAKNKLGDEYYNEIIESKDELVKYTKNAFSIIGKIGSELFSKGSSALDKWYQNFKSN